MLVNMAELKKVLEDSLLLHKRMNKLFPKRATFDTLKKKHIKLKTNLIESSDKMYDNHECIVTIISDEELSYQVNVKAVIAAMRDLKEDCSPCTHLDNSPRIIAVIDEEPVFSDEGREVNIRFQIINNVER